ncbi:hypothetical protein Tco_0791159 [Tanacetum coccineum]
MAITNSCNKHNMIACVEKTERNADFHEVIDFLTGCYVNYALLVSPDVIQQWIQQFWNTAKVRMINEVAHIEAKVAGKKILVSEASVRTDLMFNDEDGTNCFDNQSSNGKSLVHTLLHCISSKSSSWDQFGTNIASALVGLATNQKFNFSKLIFDGMLRNLKDSKPFLMYPRLRQILSSVWKKKLKKAHKKKSSSFKQGRKKVSVESTGLNEVDEGSAQANESTFEDFEGFAQANESTFEDFEGTAQANEGTFEDFEGTAQANEGTSEDFEGTAQANEGTAEVNESTVGANLSTAEVNESTVGANLSTEPSMKEVEDEAGPSTFQDESDEFIQDDTLIADLLVNISKNRRGARITIPGNIPEQERPKSPTLILDPKDKGKGIMKEEPKKKKLTLQQLRSLLRTKMMKNLQGKLQLEWEKEEKEKDCCSLKMLKGDLEPVQQASIKKRKPPTVPQDIYEKVKRFNDEFVAIGSTEDEQAIKDVVNFEDDGAQDVEVMEQHSLISRFSIIQSPEGEYIAVQRANGHIRAFNTLNEVLHILDRQDLHHLHRLVIEYYEHIPPTGLGLILHGDLTTTMETAEESDDELWRNQTEWEIISWRFYESTGVHLLELENGTMIHMLVEQRYPLIRELMQRMLEHKLEVQRETEDALNVIRFVMKQKEDLEREEE